MGDTVVWVEMKVGICLVWWVSGWWSLRRKREEEEEEEEATADTYRYSSWRRRYSTLEMIDGGRERWGAVVGL